MSSSPKTRSIRQLIFGPFGRGYNDGAQLTEQTYGPSQVIEPIWLLQIGSSAKQRKSRDLRKFREFRKSVLQILEEVRSPEFEPAFVDL